MFLELSTFNSYPFQIVTRHESCPFKKLSILKVTQFWKLLSLKSSPRLLDNLPMGFFHWATQLDIKCPTQKAWPTACDEPIFKRLPIRNHHSIMSVNVNSTLPILESINFVLPIIKVTHFISYPLKKLPIIKVSHFWMGNSING